MEPTALSLIPALVAIGLAFLSRQVVPSLFAGVVAGSVVLFISTGDPADANFLQRFFLPALGSSSYAKILIIYLWSLGALIGMWEKTGGAMLFATEVGARVAKGPRSSLVFAWLLGVVFHQGGTVSTVLAGTTVKPVTDANRVSHEEVSYVVDSTASPAATILPFNAWPAYVGALVVGTTPLFEDAEDGIAFFFTSVPYNFYGIFAVLSTLLFALGVLPWVGGRMGRAITRARETGALDSADARPLLAEAVSAVAPGYTPHLADFFVPISVLLGLAVIPYTLGYNWINEAFVACALSAMGLALARGMSLNDVLEGFLNGCKSMTIGAIVLGLAVTLAMVAKELHTADFLVLAIGSSIPPLALPAILTALCMGIAFSCGTSWGTYAVVFPVAMPLAWAVSPDPFFLHVCFGSVIGGAVFGDQCSPISDTTILSAMFTGCDLMDHVHTQLPLALMAALLGTVASTLVLVVLG